MLQRVILLLLFFFNQLIIAYPQKIKFEYLNSNDGLISNVVNCMVKDYKGYMWFGTFNGLSRYNGYEFTNYVNNPADKTSLTDNYIRTIFESKAKELFIGFQYTGFSIYNRQTETFTRYRHDDKDSNSLVNDGVLTFCEDMNGNIWIGTRGGVDMFDPVTKKFTHFSPFTHRDYIISSIIGDSSGNLWLYGQHDKICKFDIAHKSFSYLTFTDDFTNIKEFYRGGTLYYDSNKILWIGTETSGLYKYDTKSGIIKEFSVKNKKLSSNKVFSVMEDSDKNIWVGTDGGGLYKYNPQGDFFESFKHDPTDEFSLSSNAVYCVYESDPGILWVSIYASGLNVYKKHKRKFFSYYPNFKPGAGINQKSVLSIAQAEQGKVWLGTDGGGLNLFSPKSQTFEYITTSNSKIHSNIVKSIMIGRDKSLWLGSYGSGLGKINFADNTSLHFISNGPKESNKLLNANVWSLCESYDGNIWIGSMGFGIQVYEPKINHFTYYPFDTAAVRKGICNIYVLFEDSKKRMWIGTQGAGIGYYDPVSKEFKKVILRSNENKDLDNNEIGSIFEDSKQNIWLGTCRSGLVKIVDLEERKFLSYTMVDGLPSDKIVSIQEDNNKNLWLGTSNGMSMFNPETKKITYFDQQDGLINKEYNYNSSLKSADGILYFGGTEGLDAFHPDSMIFNTKNPKVVITELNIFNQAIHPGVVYNKHVYLHEDISLTQKLILTHKDYVFSIGFSALDFMASNKNKYAYRLKGFHDDWTYVSANKRFATYTNLDPGEYDFNVIASNNDGKWNYKGATLHIKVLPPWWETWWFRSAAVLATLASIIGFYYFRLRTIKVRNIILQREVQKQTVELVKINQEILQQKSELEIKTLELENANNTKDKFFSIVAHDLKGPVNALNYLTNTLYKDYKTFPSESLGDFIGYIDSSAVQVKNLVINLLEWARTQTRQISIDPVNISVKEILNNNYNLLKLQAAQKDISITFKSDGENFIYADYNMINTIVRNILSNSIKYTKKGGEIKLSYTKKENKFIEIQIQDSGIGIPENILKNLFAIDKSPSRKGTEKELGTGLGLVICNDFAKINKGSIHAESKVDCGTTFFITLPTAA